MITNGSAPSVEEIKTGATRVTYARLVGTYMSGAEPYTSQLHPVRVTVYDEIGVMSLTEPLYILWNEGPHVVINALELLDGDGEPLFRQWMNNSVELGTIAQSRETFTVQAQQFMLWEPPESDMPSYREVIRNMWHTGGWAKTALICGVVLQVCLIALGVMLIVEHKAVAGVVIPYLGFMVLCKDLLLESQRMHSRMLRRFRSRFFVEREQNRGNE